MRHHKNRINTLQQRTVAGEEQIEQCRANAVNYYVCYGSAVVSVRNAERKKLDYH
jgi:hypothetical protein